MRDEDNDQIRQANGPQPRVIESMMVTRCVAVGSVPGGAFTGTL